LSWSVTWSPEADDPSSALTRNEGTPSCRCDSLAAGNRGRTGTASRAGGFAAPAGGGCSRTNWGAPLAGGPGIGAGPDGAAIILGVAPDTWTLATVSGDPVAIEMTCILSRRPESDGLSRPSRSSWALALSARALSTPGSVYDSKPAGRSPINAALIR